MRYRVMVIGEDHTKFCYSNDLAEYDVEDHVKDAEEDYPCGQVYVEEDND